MTGRGAAVDPVRAALWYASLGWPVFPCREGEKVPATSHGFEDATTDPEVIRSWWRRWPAANPAIATGSPAIDVLDVDVRGERSGWAAFNRAKSAGLLAGAFALVRTRSGGLHAYYRGTRQRCGSVRNQYLDFKAAGGYVLVPPAYVGADDNGPAGSYEWIERGDPATAGELDWQAVRRLLVPPPRRVPRSEGGGDAGGLVRFVDRLPVGQRHPGVRWALCRAAEQGGQAVADVAAAAVAKGLPDREVQDLADWAAGQAGCEGVNGSRRGERG